MEIGTLIHLYYMKAHKIEIPNPCSEDWNEMTPQSYGRHCKSCNVVVRDFSKLSDTQIQYLLANSNGRICGQFREDQLNRAISVDRYRSAPDLLAVVLGMTVLLSAYPTYSSDLSYEAPRISLISMLNDDTTQVEKHQDYANIQFLIVSEETQEPIPFVKVILRGQNGEVYFRAESDFDGIVSFKLTPDQLDGAVSLQLRSYDYVDTLLNWDQSWVADGTYTIPLYNEIIMLRGDVEFVPMEKRKSERQQKREERRNKKTVGKIKF